MAGLSLGGVALLADSGDAPASAAVPKGLVASYGFNEGTSNATLFADRSGSPALAVGRNVRRVKGSRGRGLAFNGKNSWISIRDRPSLDLSRSMTIEAWAKPQANSGRRTILAKLGRGSRTYALYAATGNGGRRRGSDRRSFSPRRARRTICRSAGGRTSR